MARKTIGLFMAILENDFSASMLEGAAKAAKEYDANLLVFPMDMINAIYTSNDMTACRYQYNILASYMDTEGLDGLVIDFAGITESLSLEEKAEFIKNVGKKPTILLSEGMKGYASATVDNYTGLSEVINHLIQFHHYNKIGFMSGPRGNADAISRLNIFKTVMQDNKLPVDDSWTEYGNFTPFITQQVENLLDRHPDIEAIVCANDAMVVGVLEVFKKRGIVAGRDIAVTGFDDIAWGFLSDPAITTVSANPAELAYKAVAEMITNMDNLHDVRIPTKMVVRESCGCSELKLEEKWKKALRISSNWREVAQNQLEMDIERRDFEYELANIARELFFAQETGKGRYGAILDALKRLKFSTAGLFLYDEPIIHNEKDKWILPETVNLVGYYIQNEGGVNHTWDKGEKKVKNDSLFTFLEDNMRHQAVIIPLFFVKNQIGLLAVEADHKIFVSANFLAGQISTTLYIIALNEQQRKIAEELKVASESKSRFLANMSHEIRTPINSIIGFNEMIIRENTDEAIMEYASDVRTAAETLLILINDVLDFSRIEAGKVEIIPDEYDIYKLIDNCIGMVTQRAESKGLSLFKNVDKNLPRYLYGDSGRIQQILINLISNAIKYTERGTVTLSVSAVNNGDKAVVTFAVKDTGIGIKEEDIARLYNAFDRIEESRNRKIEGTGLGLNITTGLLELMNSKLDVKSKYGEGSVFSFDIEQKIINKNDVRSEESVVKHEKLAFTAPRARILAVDDNKVNLRLVKSLLKRTEIQVDLVESGAKCIEILKDNQYDIILMDHMMPEMDGIETYGIICENKLIDHDRCTVIALTANAISGAKEEYLAAGFDGYLSKPIKPDELDQMLLQHIPAEYIITK